MTRVQGTREAGATEQDYPVFVGGADATGSLRPVRTEADGKQASSIYGKGAAEGDTALLAESAAAGNLRVVLYSGTGPITKAGPSDALANSISTLTVMAVPMLWNGAAYERERPVTMLKTAQGSAVASGADLAVWTPAAGKKFRLRSLRARASAAGRYEVRDGTGTVIAFVYLEANRWTELLRLEANGYLSAAANNALLLRNASGSAADIDSAASGGEE